MRDRTPDDRTVPLLILAAGLTLVVTQRQLGPPFLLLAGIFGLVLMVCWVLATRRANQWLAFWHAQLAAAENPPPEKEIVIFGSEPYVTVAHRPVTINRMLIALMVVCRPFMSRAADN